MADDRTQKIENPYARPPEAVIEPPRGFLNTVKYLGPVLWLSFVAVLVLALYIIKIKFL